MEEIRELGKAIWRKRVEVAELSREIGRMSEDLVYKLVKEERIDLLSVNWTRLARLR